MYKKKSSDSGNFREILNYSFYGSRGEHKYRGFEYELRGEDRALVYRSGSKPGENEVARLRYNDNGRISITRGQDIDQTGYKKIMPEIAKDVKTGLKKFESHHKQKKAA